MRGAARTGTSFSAGARNSQLRAGRKPQTEQTGSLLEVERHGVDTDPLFDAFIKLDPVSAAVRLLEHGRRGAAGGAGLEAGGPLEGDAHRHRARTHVA